MSTSHGKKIAILTKWDAHFHGREIKWIISQLCVMRWIPLPLLPHPLPTKSKQASQSRMRKISDHRVQKAHLEFCCSSADSLLSRSFRSIIDGIMGAPIIRGISLKVSSNKTNNNKTNNRTNKQNSKTSQNDFSQRIWHTLVLNPDYYQYLLRLSLAHSRHSISACEIRYTANWEGQVKVGLGGRNFCQGI